MCPQLHNVTFGSQTPELVLTRASHGRILYYLSPCLPLLYFFPQFTALSRVLSLLSYPNSDSLSMSKSLKMTGLRILWNWQNRYCMQTKILYWSWRRTPLIQKRRQNKQEWSLKKKEKKKNHTPLRPRKTTTTTITTTTTNCFTGATAPIVGQLRPSIVRKMLKLWDFALSLIKA